MQKVRFLMGKGRCRFEVGAIQVWKGAMRRRRRYDVDARKARCGIGEGTMCMRGKCDAEARKVLCASEEGGMQE